MGSPDRSDFEHIRERLRHFQEPEAFAAARLEVESKVVQWRRATDQMEGIEPHYKKHFPGGRWLKEGQEGGHAHGYDERGRILIVDESENMPIKVMWFYSEAHCEEIRFDSQGRAFLIVHHRPGQGGRLEWTLFQRSDGGGESLYRWSGGRLVSQEHRYHKHSNYLTRTTPWDGRFREETFSRTTYEYGLDGEVERISIDGLLDGQPVNQPRVIYQRKKKGESLASCSKDLESALIQAVPQRLTRVKLDSPAYCLFLQYCSSGWDLAPTLKVATEAHRRAVEEEMLWWYAGEVEDPALELEWPGLEEGWRKFYQLMGSNFDPALKLLRKVAKTLNARGLDTEMPTAPDFVVTAADSSDGVEIEDDLRASVPAAQLRKVKR